MKKIKNICYLINSFPNYSETFIFEEIISLYKFGVSPYVIALKEGNTEVVHPTAEKLLNLGLVTFVNHVSRYTALKAILGLFMIHPLRTLICFIRAGLSPERWIFFQAAPYALSILKKKVDYIHAHFADFNFLFASTLSKWTGIPYGVTTHGYDLRNDPIGITCVAQLFADANLVVTISDFNRDLMVKKYKIPFDKIKIVHCGIDLTRFVFSRGSKKFNQKKIRLINIGRLVTEKGHDILIKSLSEVKNRGVDFDLTIIGSGPLRDDLVNLSHKLDLNDCIHFAGAQSQANVISMLKKSDIFVLSSRIEGLPVVCMEAMAVGTLLIAPRINGIPELVQDRVSGLLFESENISDLTEAICWTNENREFSGNMCFSARKNIEYFFDRKKCTELLIEMIEKINES